MKKILTMLVLATISYIGNAQTVTGVSAGDSWIPKAGYGGGNRSYAVSFVINNKAYVGTGLDAAGSVKDFWEYDPATNVWTRKADFGGAARDAASAFAVNGKGYICMGKSGDYPFTYYKDLWEYDPATDTWTKKADFPGIDRAYGTAFSVNGKGYYVCGYRYDFGPYSDVWEYDPAADKWTRKADYGGGPTSNPYGLAIGDKGYVGVGWNGGWKRDFYEYDPATDKWTRKADYGGAAREYVAGFSINGKGYIGVGYAGAVYKDVWEYNPGNNTWVRKADFGGGTRSGSVGFAVNNKGYIGTGNLSSTLYADVWQYVNDSTLCAAPVALKVTNITDTAAVLKWSSGGSDVTGYKIRYRAAGTTTVVKRTVKGGVNHLLICGLEPATTYEWDIRSNCSADTSAWVCGPPFTTIGSSSIAKVGITPNPNNGSFTVNAQLGNSNKPTMMRLYNNTGRMVWQIDAGSISGNVSRAVALPSTILPGVYSFTIERKNAVYKTQLIINR